MTWFTAHRPLGDNATVVVKTADGTVSAIKMDARRVDLASEDLATIISDAGTADVRRGEHGGTVNA